METLRYRCARPGSTRPRAIRVASTSYSVFLVGESGTGKSVVAGLMHAWSPRSLGPFITVACTGLQENLLESHLFGHVKGAFTGATRSKKGFFFHAHKGTLFLDEISEMPLSMQAKLLRALEEKEFYPLGGEKPIKVDTRLIAASNKQMKEEVRRGHFREDLFYRIHVIPIRLPTLRERKGDIPLLAEHCLRRVAKENNRQIKGFSPGALQKIMFYSWPGNVRELENTIECAVAMGRHDVITEDLILPAETTDAGHLPPFKQAKQGFERDYVVELMELTQGNISKAAKLAGKYRADLYELLKKYHLDPEDFRASRS